MVLEGSRAGGHFNMPQGVRSLRWDSRRRRLRSKRQSLLGEETGRDPGAGGRHVGQWPMGGVNGPGRLGPGVLSLSLPGNARPTFWERP